MSGAAWAALAAGGLALVLAWRVLFVSWVELRWPRRGAWIKTSGGRLHVFNRGKGEAVLFLHEAGANAREFLPVAALLGEGFQALLLDRPGYGFSTAAKRAAPLPQQAMLAWEALDALGVRTAILAAHGDGAAVALRMALEQPSRVLGLALASPLAFHELQAGRDSLGWAARFWGPLLAPMLAPAKLRARFRPLPPPLAFARSAGTALSLRPGAMAADSFARRRLQADIPDQMARYGEIQAPAILLTADADPIAEPTRHARILYAVLPKAELVVSPGVGHMHHAVRPHALAAAVRRLAAMAAKPPAR